MSALETLLYMVLNNGPHWVISGMGIILYFSKREERPRAATLVLAAIVINLVMAIAHPFLFSLLVPMLQQSGGGFGNQLPYVLISALLGIPHALVMGMLIWAGYMTDQPRNSSRSYRRYEDAEDDR